jgi:hypothetical protein
VTPDDEALIARHVQWFYRNRIKDPPDSLFVLALEFCKTETAILEGIDDARTLFEAADQAFARGKLKVRP